MKLQKYKKKLKISKNRRKKLKRKLRKQIEKKKKC